MKLKKTYIVIGNNMSKIETYEELFISRFIFLTALDAVIPEGKGIFLILKNKDLGFERVIVHNTDDIIGVLDAEERTDLKHGEWVTLIDGDLISN